MAPQGVEGIHNSAGPDGQYNNQTTTINNLNIQNDNTEIKQEGCCRKFTNKINRGLENFFGSIGWTVGIHPWKTIFISLSLCMLCLAGLLEYQVENRGEKSWVDQSSDALKHKDWVSEKFPLQFRSANLMLQSSTGNILTSQGLLALLELKERGILIANGTAKVQWEDICYRSANSCIPQSILELWHYNKTILQGLSNQQILDAINTPELISPMTNKPLKADLLLGGPVQKYANGTIISASVAKMTFKLQKKEIFDSGKGIPVDEDGEKWEELFEAEMKKGSTFGNIFYFTEWGREKASGDVASDDLQFFVIGYLLVIVYLAIMLGSFSRINHKMYLAAAGILVIGVAVGVAYGLGSAFQMKKTGVHDVLAFLLLGIGVDDIFVIVQNWDNNGGSIQDGRSVPEKISKTLRHAGVSILVTSVTDVCAFLIGASTILPALQSFCIWCAVGILTVFLLTITFFTACLALDAQRQENRRDACCCCIKVSDTWEATECSKKSYLQSFIQNYYAPTLLTIPGKVIGLITVVGLLAGGAYGLANLEQNFDWDWFLPPTSAPRIYSENTDIFFPSSGVLSDVYTGRMDYYTDYKTMNKIHDTLISDQYVADGSIESWYPQFHKWLNTTHTNEINVNTECIKTITACKPATNARFIELLHEYLRSREGVHYKNSIMFSQDEKDIIAASIRFQHIILQSSAEEIKAMDAIKDEIKPTTTDSEPDELLPFAYTFKYIGWETNKVITTELFRNVLLATLCVFIVTLFLLSHLWTSLLVVACVVLALIDIAGFMHFWGLTVDTVTTIILVLAIGLTVDYSAHIAHAFMVSRKGNKNERTIEALTEIGPAVVHGGMSTFLAFILLAASESYVFFTFFKVFFLVVSFGMFHGMVFLPIILSLLGPRPYAQNDVSTNNDKGVNSTVPEKSIYLQKMSQTEETFTVVTNGPKENSTFTLE